jgi:hypothetical protein
VPTNSIAIPLPEPANPLTVTNRIRVTIDLTLTTSPDTSDAIVISDNSIVEEISNPIVGLPYQVMHIPTLAEMTAYHAMISAHADNGLRDDDTLWVPFQRNPSSGHRHRREGDNAKPY